MDRKYKNTRQRNRTNVPECRDHLAMIRQVSKTASVVYERRGERRELLKLNDHFARWYEGAQTWIGTRAAWDRWVQR